MNRRPETCGEWEVYTSQNIEKLQGYPISELVALEEVLENIISGLQNPNISNVYKDKKNELSGLYMKSRAADGRLPIGLAQAEPFAFCNYLFYLVVKSKGSATAWKRPSQSA